MRAMGPLALLLLSSTPLFAQSDDAWRMTTSSGRTVARRMTLISAGRLSGRMRGWRDKS